MFFTLVWHNLGCCLQGTIFFPKHWQTLRCSPSQVLTQMECISGQLQSCIRAVYKFYRFDGISEKWKISDFDLK